MPFPMKKPMPGADMKKPLTAIPAEEKAEGEDQSSDSYIKDLLSGEEADEGGTDKLFPQDPLETALDDAGFKVTPDQLDQIKAILQPTGKPPMGGKPPMPGAPGAGKPPMGGAVPAGMQSGDMSAI